MHSGSHNSDVVFVLPTKVSLGIATLIYFVPTPLAATHQAGSLTLLTVVVWLMHELRKYKVIRK
eukprot:m.40504 g.40504  ORF g.40504 m.40504 type:complete len:64 (+) comp10358_c1_seq1:1262-1453(+)